MKILIVNDEGLFSAGSLALARVLANYHQVIVVAPEARSIGASHSFTAGNNVLRVKPYNFINNVKLFAVNGTPCDCVALALEHICKSKPDLIISGVDYEKNIGNGIVSSGNVAAAMEGTFNSIPSMSISYAIEERDSPEHAFYKVAKFINKNLNFFISKIVPKTTLNINIPVNYNKKRVMWCRTVDGFSSSNYIKEENCFGQDFLWLDIRKKGYSIEVLEQDADLMWLLKDYITITPLKSNMTDFEFNEELKRIEFKL
ncbi:MAG: hypothetical protein FWD32_02435 [Firmicutes bacterium]|nr:hypothetical protein [Bacillota bacterium]